MRENKVSSVSGSNDLSSSHNNGIGLVEVPKRTQATGTPLPNRVRGRARNPFFLRTTSHKAVSRRELKELAEPCSTSGRVPFQFEYTFFYNGYLSRRRFSLRSGSVKGPATMSQRKECFCSDLVSFPGPEEKKLSSSGS